MLVYPLTCNEPAIVLQNQPVHTALIECGLPFSYEGVKFKHKTLPEFSSREQEFLIRHLSAFITGQTCLDELRCAIGYNQDELNEILEVQS